MAGGVAKVVPRLDGQPKLRLATPSGLSEGDTKVTSYCCVASA
jgi:hypothetical protein